MFRLNDWEQYMLLDDSEKYPMSFFLRLTFDGKIDGDRWEAALHKALVRHPFFRSHLLSKRGGKAFVSTHQTPYVHVAEVGTPIVFPKGRKFIDLSKEVGTRFFVRCGTTSEVIMQIHHAVSDAKGGMQLLEDVCILYNDGQAFEKLQPLDRSKIPSRGGFHQTWSSWLRRFPLDFRRVSQFFATIPESCLSQTPESKPATVGMNRLIVTQDQFMEVKRKAKTLGVTVNDVLLTSLFRVLQRLNRESGQRGKVRVAVATDMRSDTDRDIPACNVVSMVFLDRLRHQMNDGLLQSIHKEMKEVKDRLMGLSMIGIVHIMCRAKPIFRAVLNPAPPFDCSTTAVLSNLGVVMGKAQLESDERGRKTVGNVKLKTVELFPPFRKNTNFAMGVATLDGRMAITVHRDTTAFSSADAQRVLDLMAKDLGLGTSLESLPIKDSIWHTPIGRNVRPSENIRAH